MASSSSSSSSLLLPLLLLLLLPQSSLSLTCSSQTFSKNKLYSQCTDLPNLSAYLHWTLNSTDSSLSIAFQAPPASPNGWVSWAINPTGTGMMGSQALVAYKKPDGSMTVKTFNISSFNEIHPSKISFEVPEMEAEIVNGVMRIYAKIMLEKKIGTKLTQVWQVGASVKGDNPAIHDFKPGNLNSKNTLDLLKGETTATPGASADSRLKKKNIHGILNVVSWGVMFPFGILFARYLKTFQSADPAWFYLHVFCQCSAYVIGVAGWGTGLKIGSESKGITYSTHRNLGIALFSLATLQVFALFLRPQKEHKYRIYWNFYHHGVGYAIVVMGILNVFKGLDILVPEKKWRTIYITFLVVLGVVAALLEAITWTVVLRRKKSAKTYGGSA